MPWAERDRVCRIELQYARPADVLAALQQAVHPRTYDSSERFTPLTELRQFHSSFEGRRFRFRCGIGASVRMAIDVDGEVLASPSGGTTIRMSLRPAHRRLQYVASAALLAWLGFFAWSAPHGVGIPLLALAAYSVYSWPTYFRRAEDELEVRLRELGPFLRSRIPPV